MANRIDNVALMKKFSIGVEVECSGISMLLMIQVVANHFGTIDSIRATRYDHDGSTLRGYECDGVDCNGVINTWRVVGDASLSSSRTNLNTEGGCGELVTPVLHYNDIECLQEIIRKLRRAGARSNAGLGCGVHIHVGANIGQPGGHTPQSLRRLSNLMASHEELLIKACGVSYSRYACSGYTQRSNTDYIEALNRIRPTTMESLIKVWYESQESRVPQSAVGNHYNHTRYHMLNLHSCFLPYIGGNLGRCTTEFRLFEFHEKMHAGELKAYIQLCLAMSSYSILVSRITPEPVNLSNEKRQMKTWLDNLGLIGDEFETCRKILRKNLSGDSAYRDGRPTTDDDEFALDA